ncbi:hypothetical protein Cs7R123_44970 [Catellatospora sp. TT07R-123]|uniref:hypothetical protein n=1 Tax=Catellatospora sp. TT07R-123 TaxID=2733863 RepID=UPI001B2019A4|nr:hypothetical protein [Catellatospora sp. TT07R-123]GHJ47155.1 hypothetical protein Cs7R123_44970 [Catellatospora sp. TT07R-123]
MTSAPREAEARIGPIGALLCRLAFLAICLPGPVLLAFALALDAQAPPQDFWGLLAGGVITTIAGVCFGVFGLRLVTRSRRDARQLAATGVAATAEVIAVEHHLGGEDPGLKLRLRISGSGFTAFDAETTRPDDPALVPGALLAALVDPADCLYRVA